MASKPKNEELIPIRIRSKNDLAKRISNKELTYPQALELLKFVESNYDRLWKDNKKMSDAKKGKWVRDASGTRLGLLLKLIDNNLLAQFDNRLPFNIYGGVRGKNHKTAAMHLLGYKNQRTLLKMDLHRFFEQNKLDRVFDFFYNHAGCSKRMSHYLARLCCVPFGRKEDPKDYLTLARGFSTSPRLAAWCNIQSFREIDKIARVILAGYDPKISIFVDDIGITASRVPNELLIEVYDRVQDIMDSDSSLRKLTLNDDKCFIIRYNEDAYDTTGNFIGKKKFELLGLQMGRNSVRPGTKSKAKLGSNINKIKTATGKEREKLRRSIKGQKRYKGYIIGKG